MKKEALTFKNVKRDLDRMAYSRMSSAEDHRLGYIIPAVLLAVILAVVFKSVVVTLLLAAFAAYHTVYFVIACRKYKESRKALEEAVERADISISVEKLSHIAEETVYEPHQTGVRRNEYKTVRHFYFEAGGSWRVPDVYRHYEWSSEYYLTTKGLDNISIKGDEFYYISLQGFGDVAYIYPCKFFTLDDHLREKKSRSDQ